MPKYNRVFSALISRDKRAPLRDFQTKRPHAHIVQTTKINTKLSPFFTFQSAIIIHEVYPDGAAAKDGRLRPGDQILEVNTEDFRSTTHTKALAVLRQTPAKVSTP